MAGISVAMIIGIGLVIGAFIMFRFAHVLMTIAGIAGVFSGFAGIIKMGHHCNVPGHDAGLEIAGAMLVGVGVFTILALGITLKALRPDAPKLGTKTPATPDE